MRSAIGICTRGCTDNTKISDIQERLEFAQSIPSGTYGRFEWQAYNFAGLILVPGNRLADVVNKNVDLVSSRGISLHRDADYAWDYISEGAAKSFNVSSRVIFKRIEKDMLKNLFHDH